MSIDNQLWGAPRIHGELLKLGFDVGQTTVAKYMARVGVYRHCSEKHLQRNLAEFDFLWQSRYAQRR